MLKKNNTFAHWTSIHWAKKMANWLKLLCVVSAWCVCQSQSNVVDDDDDGECEEEGCEKLQFRDCQFSHLSMEAWWQTGSLKLYTLPAHSHESSRHKILTTSLWLILSWKVQTFTASRMRNYHNSELIELSRCFSNPTRRFWIFHVH